LITTSRGRNISIVIPAYNEAECLEELVRQIVLVIDPLRDRYEFEIIFIENGSVDATYDILRAVREADKRFKILKLSRNFGPEAAVISGLRCATGDAAIIMYADLQDPPDLIPQFLEKWESGYDNVYGIITRRPDESALRRFYTRIFYFIINKVSDQPVPQSVSDFRLVDRRKRIGQSSLNYLSIKADQVQCA
jgi:dolichol-phosphate mannosyltransferase